MRKLQLSILLLLVFATGIVLVSCKKETPTIQAISAIDETFKGNINLNHLENYASQSIPSYITKDNSGSNFITDKGATLGRVLF
jgi:cytochrome c peroxidase